MADIRVKESFRQRRVGGAALVFIGLPLTLFWARFGLPLRWDFGDLVFFLGGPGILLLGLWAAFPWRAPRVRLSIGDRVLTLYSRTGDQTVMLDQLLRIRKERPLTAKFHQLTFETASEQVDFDVIQMTHEANEIINLISIRLEMLGKHLREGRTAVLGAQSGVWEVETGNPFEKLG